MFINFAHQDRAPLVTRYADFPVESTLSFQEVSAMQAGIRRDVKQAWPYIERAMIINLST